MTDREERPSERAMRLAQAKMKDTRNAATAAENAGEPNPNLGACDTPWHHGDVEARTRYPDACPVCGESALGIDADAVLAAQLEYLRQGGVSSPRRRKLEKKLVTALPKLTTAEADMRRSFNRWDKARAEVHRLEHLLDVCAKEESQK